MSDVKEEEAAGPSFLWRHIQDVGRQLFESVPPMLKAAGSTFDNWGGDLAVAYRQPFRTQSGHMLEWEGGPAPVAVADRTHVCVHITAIEYGTTAGKRRQWRKRIDAGQIPEPVLAMYDHDELGTEKTAERMALHERFWTVAYHWVGLRNGDILYNNDITRYTFHGNSANDHSIGVSAEADMPALERRRRKRHTPLDDQFIETNRMALRFAVLGARNAGAPLEWVTAHRCYSDKRRGDPGEGYWREVVLPVAGELDLQIDYEHSQGSGLPIPREWDPAAHYDFQGKPVPQP